MYKYDSPLEDSLMVRTAKKFGRMAPLNTNVGVVMLDLRGNSYFPGTFCPDIKRCVPEVIFSVQNYRYFSQPKITKHTANGAQLQLKAIES